jgi:hypothetical protein
VLGQPDFTTGAAPLAGPTAGNFKYPYGILVTGGKLYITSKEQSRVLGYNSVPTTNSADADFVLGQSNLTSQAQTTTSTGLYYPYGIATYDNKLIVADNNNYRVLIWNSLPTTTAAAAVIVVGQVDMESNVVAVSQTSFSPVVVAASGGKMVVTDNLNSRALLYNSIPTADDAAADLVLGQVDFTTSTSGLTATNLDSPMGAWTDGTMIIIADTGNKRVLIWNTWPTSNGQAADVVIGQTDFTSNTSTGDTTSTLMGTPFGIAVGGGRLFVSDQNNNRILVYNTIPTSNGAAADAVIGQDNFEASGSGTTAARLYNPSFLAVSSNSLWVADTWNHRVLRFDLEE